MKDSILHLMPVIDIMFKVMLIILDCIATWYFLSHKLYFRNTLTQLVVISILIGFFLNSALFFNFNDVGLLSYVMVFSFNLLLFIILYTWVNEMSYKRLSLKNTNYFFSIILIYSIIKIFFIINYLPRWDSAVYYYRILHAVKDYDFSLISYLKDFRLSLYPCYAYFSFLSIGQFVDFGNVYLLNIQHHLLSIAAIYCFYKIICKFSPNTGKFEISIITLIFSFSPILFSVFCIPSADTPVISFYIIFLYCYLYRKSLLLIFSSVVLCTSKDPGFILYFFSVLGILSYNILPSFNDKKNIIQIFKRDKTVIYLLAPIFIYVLSKIATGLIYPSITFGSFWDSKGFNCFGINFDIIKDRLSQIFLVNFQWFFLLIIIIFILRKFYESIFLKKAIIFNFNKFNIFIFPFAAYVLFNIIFITWAHPRYISALVFFIILFFYMSISELIKKYKFRITILLTILLLSLLSVFRTFDPVTLAVFKDRQIIFGEHKMVTMGKYYDDEMLYNGQFLFIDLLFNKFNKEYNISNNDTLLFSNWRWEIGFDEYGGDKFRKDGYIIYIDEKSKKRTFKTKDSFVPVAYYNLVSDSIKKEKLPTNGYYLSFMWSAVDSINLIKVKKIYDISNERTIKLYGYSMNVYEVQKINTLMKETQLVE